MKKIYIIFSKTDLKIGKMIRLVTQNEYNHTSVCLKEDLSRFYSFSRVYRNNPLIGGFVTESPCRYTLSSRVRIKIVEIAVSDEKYELVREHILMMKDRGDEYVYNFFSAAVYPFGRSFSRNNAFTCAEFTHSILKIAGIVMPQRANIKQMELALTDYPTVEGRATELLGEPAWGEDRYLEHIGKRSQAIQILSRFRKLVLGHV